MGSKDILDACTKQAEYFSERFDERRAYEWKTTVALWTLLAAGINFIKTPVPLWIPALLTVAYAFLWLRGIWLANYYDKERAKYYQEETYRLLRETSKVKAPPDIFHQATGRLARSKKWFLSKRLLRFWFGFLLDWSMLFQLTSTIVLVILFYEINQKATSLSQCI